MWLRAGRTEFLLAAVFALTLGTSVSAADLSSGPSVLYTCGRDLSGNRICKVTSGISCEKGNLISIPPRPPGERAFFSSARPPIGDVFVVSSGRSVITESRNDGQIYITNVTKYNMTCQFKCRATLFDDSFAYGYCVVRVR